jgi:hypothetical protein
MRIYVVNVTVYIYCTVTRLPVAATVNVPAPISPLPKVRTAREVYANEQVCEVLAPVAKANEKLPVFGALCDHIAAASTAEGCLNGLCVQLPVRSLGGRLSFRPSFVSFNI